MHLERKRSALNHELKLKCVNFLNLSPPPGVRLEGEFQFLRQGRRTAAYDLWLRRTDDGGDAVGYFAGGGAALAGHKNIAFISRMGDAAGASAIGGSVLMQKQLIPILHGVSPDELPGWSKEFQAVGLREDRSSVRRALDAIADSLLLDRILGVIIVVALGCFLVWLFTRKG